MKQKKPIYIKISLFCCSMLMVLIGYGQSYNKAIFSFPSIATGTFVNGLPDPACNAIGFKNINMACVNDPDCLNSFLENIPVDEFHLLENLESNTFSISSYFPLGGWLHTETYYATGVGRPEYTLTQFPTFYQPQGCTTSMGLPTTCQQGTQDITIMPTSGSRRDALIFNVPNLSNVIVGGVVFPETVILPIIVEGVIYTEVDAIGSVVTPQIPYLILHDPPGDGSFSEFDENTTICRSTSTTYQEDAGGGFTGTAKAGVAGSIGVVIEQDFEFSIGVTQDFNMVHSNTNSNTEERCVEISNSFQTSAWSNVSSIGDGADVFVGYGETLILGVYDSISYNSCNLLTTNGLAYAPDPNGYTTFIRTANDILADITLQTSILNDMSNDLTTRTRASNQIKIWQDVLAKNEANVANANELIGNYNFTGGSNFTYSEGVSTTEINEISYDVAIESSTSIDIVAVVGANGFTGGPQFSFNKKEGATTSSSSTNNETFSYTFNDDDIGDIFNCNAYRDPDYGTPIFRLNAGSKTSCPYEGWVKRDQPEVNWSGYGCNGTNTDQLYVISDTQPASISLNLCNNSVETRVYQLSIDNNTNNATVTEGGTVLNNTIAGNTDHSIGANACTVVTVSIAGNGSINDSHEIDFILSPQCGGFPNVEINDGDITKLNINFAAGAPFVATGCTKRLYVDESATGANIGSDWSNAFNYLQDALDVATQGDTIWVAAGTYYPDEGANQTDNNINGTFSVVENITVIGGFAGTELPSFNINQRDIIANQTILSGDINQLDAIFSNSFTIVYLANGTLDGFTITKAKAPNSVPGTAISIPSGYSTTIRNCNIVDNQCGQGSSIYVTGFGNPTIINCSFMGNESFSGGGAITFDGVFDISIPNSTIKYCSFAGNYTITGAGAAVRFFDGTPVDISHSIFWGNGLGTGNSNIDIYSDQGIIDCDYCIIDTDGGGVYPGIGGVNMDPLFVNQPPITLGSNADLRLQAGSPAIDFLTDATAPITDQDGKLRPIGLGDDIGAFEHGEFTIDITSDVYSESCSGGDDGNINITISTPGNYTYLWNDGITYLDRTNLSTGLYTVTITETTRNKDFVYNFFINKFSNGLYFDGIDDVVNIPDDPALDLQSDFTLSAYINPTSFGAATFDNVIVSHVTGWDGYNLRCGGSGRLEFTFGNGSDTFESLASGANGIQLDQWQHVAIVRNGNVYTMYIDGVLINTLNASINLAASPAILAIGSEIDQFNRRFHGSIDEIRIWNKARSSSEIQADLQRSYCDSDPDLIAYYPMNECNINTTILDASYNAFHGLIYGATQTPLEGAPFLIQSQTDGTDCCVTNCCTATYNLSGNLNTNTVYESSGLIKSTQVIQSGTNTTYDAGTCIELNSGFEVIIGAEFDAFIDGCNN